jgi:hypothetical protein
MTQKNYTPIDDLIKKWPQNDIISLPSKEAEPILKKEIEFKEAKEKEIEEEIRPHVVKRQEIINLPPDLKNLGLKPISTTQFPQYQTVKLPISDEKIITGLSAPVFSSLRWLATLALYLLQQAHLSLKVVGGRVVRVLKR